MNLNCDGDYRLQEQWLDKHRDASSIVYDTVSGLPVKAEYANPIYTSYVEEPRKFFAAVRQLMEQDPADHTDESQP